MKKVLAIMLAAAIGLSLSAQPKRLTVKEFLKLSPKDTASYIVNGVVSKIRSASSGSFYLTDRTGTMLGHPHRSGPIPPLRRPDQGDEGCPSPFNGRWS